jgi:hypothetical protein
VSYKLIVPQRRRPQQPVTLLPLSDLPSAPAHGMSRGFLIAIAIAIVLLFLVWLLTPKDERKQLRSNPVRKMSTAELAKNLYERLERRGSANPSTMRSLEAYSRKRT